MKTRSSFKKIAAALFFTLIFAAAPGFPALAASTARPVVDDAPLPKRAPRIPVSAQKLEGSTDKPLSTLAKKTATKVAEASKPVADPKPEESKIVEGQATAIDTERLHIGDTDIRLFGVVPPQLSASYGPQARAWLDQLIQGETVTCRLRDQDARIAATCGTAKAPDLALALLQQGLAVVARGSVRGTELAETYAQAEDQAQKQKVGLWSVVPVSAAVTILPVGQGLTKTAAPPATEVKPVPENPPAKVPAETRRVTKEEAPVVASGDTPVAEASIGAEPPASEAQEGFWGSAVAFSLLAAIFVLLGVQAWQRFTGQRDERRTLAAALRGELMAARTICQTRADALAKAEDKHAVWPRIRTMVFQAHVGRIGHLGAELARKTASIYGQTADYGAFYQNRPDAAGMRQTLLTLVRHITEVVVCLEQIEQTGRLLATGASVPRAQTVQALPTEGDAEEAETESEEERVPTAETPKPDKKEDLSAPVAEEGSTFDNALPKQARRGARRAPPSLLDNDDAPEDLLAREKAAIDALIAQTDIFADEGEDAAFTKPGPEKGGRKRGDKQA